MLLLRVFHVVIQIGLFFKCFFPTAESHASSHEMTFTLLGTNTFTLTVVKQVVVGSLLEI